MRIKRYILFFEHYLSSVRTNPLLLIRKGWNFLVYLLSKKGACCYNLPISAQIEPTLRCNLRCPMCVRSHFKQGDMNLEDFKRVISKLNTLVKVHLQGLGEPFLNKDIFSMIDYAAYRGIVTSIITNGTMFNDTIIDKIVKANIFELGISIDSVEKESYESMRLGANFDKTKKGVMQLSAALRKHKKNTRLFLAVTVMRSNLCMMPDLIRFANEVGVNRVVFQRVQTKADFVKYYGADFTKSNEFVTCGQVQDTFNESMSLAKSLSVEIIFEENNIGCLWPWRGIYVTWKGDITPCCMIVDSKSLSLGNIFEAHA